MSLECECRNPPHNRVGGILPVYEVSGKSSACVTEAIRYGINTLSRDQSHFWVHFYVSTESLYSNNEQNTELYGKKPDFFIYRKLCE